MKNACIHAFLKCTRKPSHPQKKRFLIVSTTALGDTLWATPAIESLRLSFPDAFIGCLTSPIGMEVLKYNPNIDRLYLLQKLFKLRKTLYQEKFDTVLLFHASQRLTLPLCASIGASRIVGSEGINKGLDDLLTDPMPKTFEHEIVRRLALVEKIGGKIHTENLSLFLQPEEILKKQEGLRIALHPGSKDRFKRWPEKNFAEVGRAFKNAQIVITGSKGEEEIVQKVASMIPGAKVLQNLPLRQFAAEINRMDLLICNDTGPFHLACSLNTPAIGLFAATDPKICGPHLAKNALAISKKPTCMPCLKKKCQNPFCLLQIGSCEVIEAALKMLPCPKP